MSNMLFAHIGVNQQTCRNEFTLIIISNFLLKLCFFLDYIKHINYQMPLQNESLHDVHIFFYNCHNTMILYFTIDSMVRHTNFFKYKNSLSRK